MHLETRWSRGDDIEVLFEGKACLCECALVKQAPDERDAMRDTAWRVELGERMGWVGGPVATRFGDLDESGAKCERWVAGEVGQGEHLVT